MGATREIGGKRFSRSRPKRFGSSEDEALRYFELAGKEALRPQDWRNGEALGYFRIAGREALRSGPIGRKRFASGHKKSAPRRERLLD